MEIGNQYVNYATLKNKRGIREQGKPQIQTQKKKKNHTKTGVSFDKREKKKKSENME